MKAAGVIGTVVTGMGGAAQAIQDLSDEDVARFGYTPFPGTLNLRVSPDDHARVAGAANICMREGDTRLGPIYWVQCWVGPDLKGHVKPHGFHPDVVEVASPVCLREVLGVTDGDQVEVDICQEGPGPAIPEEAP